MLCVLLTGCNGLVAPTSVSVAVSGTVSAGPIQGATVTAYSLSSNGYEEAVIGTAITDAGGNYSMDVLDTGEPLALVVTGGQYSEEASGSAVSMGAAQLRTFLPSVADGQQVGITPVTEIAAQAALAAIPLNLSTGLAALIHNVNAQVSETVGLSDITLPPANPNQPAAQARSSEAAQYAVVLGAISELASTAGTANSTTINSLDLMQSLATAYTYNGNFDATIGAANVPVPNAAGSSISLTSVLGGSTNFSTAMQSAMTTYLSQPGVTSLGYSNTSLTPAIRFANSPSRTNVVTLPSAPSTLPSGRPIVAGLPPFAQASHTALPQVQFGGGNVLNSPKIKAIHFLDDGWASQLDQFVTAFGSSSELNTMVSEYGGSDAASVSTMTFSTYAPYDIDDLVIQAWLKGQLGSSLGSPDSNTIYVIFYPASTTVTNSGLTGCIDFGGYHSSFTDGVTIHYAVIPECYGDTVNSVTAAVSHEIIETISDPDTIGTAGYMGVDSNSTIWSSLSGPEIGDLCEMYASSFYVPPDIGFGIQRTWSNVAAAAGNNPCIPAASGSAYFNSAPVLPDSVSYYDPYQGTTTTKGVYIPIGQSKTITIQLFSDAMTSDNWNVSAMDTSASGNSNLNFSFDSTVGSNGTVIHLTITALQQDANFQGEPFWIVSQLGSEKHSWPVIVGN